MIQIRPLRPQPPAHAGDIATGQSYKLRKVVVDAGEGAWPVVPPKDSESPPHPLCFSTRFATFKTQDARHVAKRSTNIRLDATVIHYLSPGTTS